MDDTSTSSTTKGSGKLLGTALVIGLVLLLIVIDTKRRSALAQLEKVSMKLSEANGGGNQQGKDEAKKIVAQLKTIYALPDGVDPTVATVVDPEKLAKQNDFYKNAKKGDYLVVTPQRAILFRASENLIVDVVPVQITPPNGQATNGQQQAQVQGQPQPGTPAPVTQPSSKPAPSPSPTPLPQPTPAPSAQSSSVK